MIKKFSALLLVIALLLTSLIACSNGNEPIDSTETSEKTTNEVTQGTESFTESSQETEGKTGATVPGDTVPGDIVPTDPAAYTEGLEFGLFIDGNSYGVSKYTGTDAEVIIPSVYMGKPVKFIFYNAFASCFDITKVTMPDSITGINETAFSGCISLKEIRFSQNLEYISSAAFQSCYSLTEVVIPDSVTRVENSFSRCTNLIKATVGKNVTKLYYTFFECPKLVEIYNLSALDLSTDDTISAKIIHTDKNAPSKIVDQNGFVFYSNVDTNEHYLMGYVGDKKELTLPYTINNNSYEIHPYAFYGLDITKVTFNNSITAIGTDAFSNCDALTEINIPESVTHIGEGAFSACDELASVTLPDSIVEIPEYAFSGCMKLTEITLGANTVNIAPSAFSGCVALMSITIPEKVQSIGEYAFEGCERLVEVFNLSDIDMTVGSEDNGKIAYYAKRVHTSKASSNIKVLGDYLVYSDNASGSAVLLDYLGTETELTLPSSIDGYDYEIAAYAFFDSNLQNVSIPEGVTAIGTQAFTLCNFTTLTLPDGLKTIGVHAFQQVPLTEINLPNSITHIDISAFWCRASETTVNYRGTEEQWNAMVIEVGNESLISATRNYVN